MSTARKSTGTTRRSSATVKPQARLIVADDIRTEESGKVTAIGLFADSVVVIPVDPKAPEFNADLPFGIDTLCMLVNITGLKGKHRVKVAFGAYVKNSPPQSFVEGEYEFPSEGSSVSLLAKFRPLLVKTFGKKTVSVFIDEKLTQKLYFEVRRQVVDLSEARSKLAGAVLPQF